MVICILATVAALACNDLPEPIRSLFSPPASRYLNGVGTVVVYPGNLHGWSFYDRAAHATCTSTTGCTFASGPTGQPLGSGSAELASPTNDGVSLQLADYRGVGLSHLTRLDYYAYQKAHGTATGTIKLILDVDFDMTDSDTTGYQLIFDPPTDTSLHAWQFLDTRIGALWYALATNVIKGGVTYANPCLATAPCTWAQVLDHYPNAGIHPIRGQVALAAGGFGFAGFRGDVDAFSIGIDGATTTFDFELAGPVPSSAPDSVPRALLDSLGMISGPPLSASESYRKRIVAVSFLAGTTQAQRQAVIDSIGGIVVGGRAGLNGSEGYYYFATWWQVSDIKPEAFRRPIDGSGWNQW